MIVPLPRRRPAAILSVGIALALGLAIVTAGLDPGGIVRAVEANVEARSEAKAPHDWPRLRGLAGAGQGGERGLPADWVTRAWDWSTPLPGLGHASPVVWDGLVVTAAADPEKGTRWLVGLGLADGAIRWKVERPGSVHHTHKFNDLASSTPAIDAAGIYWMQQRGENVVIEAFAHDGRARWEVDLGPYASQHGLGSSPAVWNGLVIVPLENDGPSRVVALDAATGAERWSLARDTNLTAYATPLVLDGPRPIVVLASTAHGLAGVDVKNGRLLWEQKCLPRRAVSSPVLCGGRVLATCGAGNGDNLLAAVRVPDVAADAAAPAAGSVPAPPIDWTLDKSVAPYVPTPLVTPRGLFLWSDRGVVTKVDEATGEVQWRGRVGGNYFASPVSLGDAVLGISTDGEMVLVGTGTEFAILGQRALEEVVRGTPAVADGRLVVRTEKGVMALSLAKE
jgi:outer membrane protein assembly factor BamB